MSKVKLHDTMDAVVWAKEFMRLFGPKLNEVDEGLMVAWFANSIMCGWDHAHWQKDFDLLPQLTSAQEKLKVAEEALERISSSGGVYPKVCADLALAKIRGGV